MLVVVVVVKTASLMFPWHGLINKHSSNRQQATTKDSFEEQQHFLLGDIVCAWAGQCLRLCASTLCDISTGKINLCAQEFKEIDKNKHLNLVRVRG